VKARRRRSRPGRDDLLRLKAFDRLEKIMQWLTICKARR
jgi:hypothetical protein